MNRPHSLLDGRQEAPEEVAPGLRFLKEAAAPGLAPWGQYAQALLEANEFTFVD